MKNNLISIALLFFVFCLLGNPFLSIDTNSNELVPYQPCTLQGLSGVYEGEIIDKSEKRVVIYFKDLDLQSVFECENSFLEDKELGETFDFEINRERVYC